MLWIACLVLGLFVWSKMEQYYLVFDSYISKILDRINISKKWREGEQLVYNELIKILNLKNLNKYKIYRNIKIPNRKFDIDLVVTWPKGIIVIEVKNCAEKIHFLKDHAETTKSLTKYKKVVTELYGRSDPRKPVIYHCDIFIKYLNEQKISNLRIKKIIVYTKDIATWDENNGVYIVSGINKLNECIDWGYEDKKFTQNFCDKLDTVLSKISLNK